MKNRMISYQHPLSTPCLNSMIPINILSPPMLSVDRYAGVHTAEPIAQHRIAELEGEWFFFLDFRGFSIFN